MVISIHNSAAHYTLHFRKRRDEKRGDIYTVAQRFRVRWEGERLNIPVGFESDGASVPRILWGLVFPSGDYNAIRAALAHDFVYRRHPEGWTKEAADRMFYDVMIRDGVPRWRAWIAYKGVDWFGGLAWKTHGGC